VLTLFTVEEDAALVLESIGVEEEAALVLAALKKKAGWMALSLVKSVGPEPKIFHHLRRCPLNPLSRSHHH
jgi:hypothetical protein